jgi:type I restriction enzyme S subunit
MSWETVKISDFAEVVTGGTPSTKVAAYWEGGTIPWLPSGACQNCRIETADTFITELGLRESAAKMMPANTVVIALTGATTGKVGILGFDACANQSVTGILPNEKFIPEYLFHYLIHIREKIVSDSYGGAQKHISQGYVKDLCVVLPDTEIQQSIAKACEQVQSLIGKRREQLQILDKLTKDIFIELFGNPSTNPMDWDIGTIRDLVTEVKYGTSKPAVADGKHIYLRMNNITYEGEMDFTDLKSIDLSDDEFIKYSVKKGDLLFNRTNSKELVGKTAVFREETPMVIAGYIIRVRTNERANADYISGFLNSKYGKSVLFAMCKAIVGQANINAQELQDIQIPIPPIELQNEYAEKIAAVLENKARLQASLAGLETTYKSTLQKAFNGELFQ